MKDHINSVGRPLNQQESDFDDLIGTVNPPFFG
jgi:hypothetical protein